jgi:hypothetical protein
MPAPTMIANANHDIFLDFWFKNICSDSKYLDDPAIPMSVDVTIMEVAFMHDSLNEPIMSQKACLASVPKYLHRLSGGLKHKHAPGSRILSNQLHTTSITHHHKYWTTTLRDTPTTTLKR